MDSTAIEDILVSEVRLTSPQARVYLLITCHGRMSAKGVSQRLGIPEDGAGQYLSDLVDRGALIRITDTEFEAMHPRFTAVNMYRRMCEREDIEFKRNKAVDSIGAILEKPYDDARTK